ncbi:regucalcin [Agrilus planipennis]|uniref:Regucalcin n=1 Tax=Agrilus planipennis TaxID=224129 RepID=A0A1W4XG08_AGRPL|nr:regucalcin [Agrilus planipennis]XP_018331279.1 regucalcin [Agrilus planipennis]XP_018331280.1 regucalcin [Agrilus planipennis]
MTSDVKIEKLPIEPLDVGTRPHWDAEKQCLYLVDIPNSTVYKYIPSQEKVVKAKVGNEPLGFMFPVANKSDQFIAGLGRKFCLIKWDGISSNVSSVETIAEVDTEPNLSSNRLNCGKIDPFGRLWAGTMGPTGPDGVTIPKMGSLYSLSRRTIKKHEGNVSISNGCAWNIKTRKMYYIDTLFPGVYEYDYDLNTGDISNRKVIFEFGKHHIPGLPDGMLIDTEDMLWIAVIHGSRVIRINPNSGTLLNTIMLPTPQVTAICFGDSSLSSMYITTAQIKVDGKIPEPPAGSTYVIRSLSPKGLVDSNFVL